MQGFPCQYGYLYDMIDQLCHLLHIATIPLESRGARGSKEVYTCQQILVATLAKIIPVVGLDAWVVGLAAGIQAIAR